MASISIKVEKKEDPEILDMAVKLIQANKLKMASINQNNINNLNNIQKNRQQNILNYGVINSVKQNTSCLKDSSPQLDNESIMGKFGWTCFGKDLYFPFIYRLGEKYCAVRMVENLLLVKYLPCLPSDIYKCTCIRSYYITENEARLLNEINNKHCDTYFGKQPFTTTDFIVRLQDAEHFYEFLELCYKKLILKLSDENDLCGFFRINGESVVPYTMKNNAKYVPLFYFEGETENLMKRKEIVEGWELAYLKFCCKVQGIKNELFEKESCLVVSLEDIKQHFPEATIFEEWWPTKFLVNPKLLPPGSISCTTPSNDFHFLDYSKPTNNLSFPCSTVKSDSCDVSSNIAVACNSTISTCKQNSISATVSQNRHSSQLPPLVKVPPHVVRQNSYVKNDSAVRPISHTIDNMINEISNKRLYSSTSSLNPVKQSISSVYQNTKKNSNNPHNLLDYCPYRLQKVSIQGKIFLCINQNPFCFNQSLLLKFDDMLKSFFPNTSKQICQEALTVLGIPLHKCNLEQMKILITFGKTELLNNTIFLVPVQKVSDFLHQIIFMCSVIEQRTLQHPNSKRIRTS